MSLLRAILSLDEPFRGLGPLLSSKRSFVKASFYAGLTITLFLGLTIGVLGDARNSEEAPAVILALLGTMTFLVAFFLPIVGSAYLTTSRTLTPAGGRCRREELLTLPIGRLVIPSQILLASLGAVTAFVLGSLIATGLTFGPKSVWAALTLEQTPLIMSYALPVLIWLFLTSNAFTAVGNSNAFLGLGWFLIPVAILPALQGMGYDGDIRVFLWLWGVPLSAFYLLVPFALYALPNHHWSDIKLSDHPHHLLAQTLVYPLLVVLLILGWAPLALGLLVCGAGVFRLARKQPAREHRPASGIAVTLGMGLAFSLPPLAVCLAIDAWVLSTPITQETCVVARTLPSPDGKRVALEVKPRPSDCEFLEDLTLVRIVIADPTGATPPKTLSPRFGRIGGWSSDGRYLAFHDETVGRFHSDYEVPDPVKMHPRERILMALKPTLARTLIYDTETDAVVAKLPRRIVRPGWTSPTELVHLSLSARDAQLHLEDGTGRSIAVDTQARKLLVLRYEPEGPVFARPHRVATRTYPYVAGLGPAERAFQRWTPTGLVDVDTSDRWQIAPLLDAIEKKRLWAERVARKAAKAKIEAEFAALQAGQKTGKRRHKAKRKRRSLRAYRLSRGEEALDVRGVFRLVQESCTDDAVLAVTPAGIVRISLPDGKRTVLIPITSPRQGLPLEQVSGRWVSRLADRTVLIEGDRTTDLGLTPEGQLLEAILPDHVVLTRSPDRLRTRLITPEGEQRALLPN